MPQTVSVNVKFDPSDLDKKQALGLAGEIVKISSKWSEIEEELSALYSVSSKTAPVLAAAALGAVDSPLARLEMIQVALRLFCPPRYVEKFDKELRRQVRSCARMHNKVIYCQWAIHNDYPGQLISFGGLTNSERSVEAYKKHDFQKVLLRLTELHVALKEFIRSLASDPDFAKLPVGKRLGGTTPGQPAVTGRPNPTNSPGTPVPVASNPSSKAPNAR